MASIIEAIKVTSSVVPRYDGDEQKLDGVTRSIKALEPIVDETNRQAVINIVLSKLDGLARDAVGNAPRNLQEIVNKLTEKCRKKRTPEIVLAMLYAVKQKGSVEELGNEIEKLTRMLEAAYIAEETSLEMAHKKATKSGIKALAYGMNDSEARIIILARRFETLSDAIEMAIELELDAHLITAQQNNKQQRSFDFTGNQHSPNNYREICNTPKRCKVKHYNRYPINEFIQARYQQSRNKIFRNSDGYQPTHGYQYSQHLSKVYGHANLYKQNIEQKRHKCDRTQQENYDECSSTRDQSEEYNYYNNGPKAMPLWNHFEPESKRRHYNDNNQAHFFHNDNKRILHCVTKPISTKHVEMNRSMDQHIRIRNKNINEDKILRGISRSQHVRRCIEKRKRYEDEQNKSYGNKCFKRNDENEYDEKQLKTINNTIGDIMCHNEPKKEYEYELEDIPYEEDDMTEIIKAKNIKNYVQDLRDEQMPLQVESNDENDLRNNEHIYESDSIQNEITQRNEESSIEPDVLQERNHNEETNQNMMIKEAHIIKMKSNTDIAKAENLKNLREKLYSFIETLKREKEGDSTMSPNTEIDCHNRYNLVDITRAYSNPVQRIPRSEYIKHYPPS